MRLTSLLHLSSSRLPSGSRVAGGLRPCPDGMRREGWRREVNGILSLMSSVPYHPRPSLTSPYPPHRRNGVT